METIAKKAKVRDSVYLPEETIGRIKELAKLLGCSKNDIHERAIDMLYAKRFLLAQLRHRKVETTDRQTID
jgi:hypothetical protein